VGSQAELAETTEALRVAGCVAAEQEAAVLVATAGGDPGRLAGLVGRRSAGEPLAWLVGWTRFCEETVFVHPGVYVPRPQTEALALEAVARLPVDGAAVDLCTGSGAIAVVLGRRRPAARIFATEIDPLALACAQSNGVDAFAGDLSAGLPIGLHGLIDVVTAVVPYVPTDALRLLPRDVQAYEPRQALDGGPDGLRFLARAVEEAARLLRPSGSLLVELGGAEGDLLAPVLDAAGFGEVDPLVDDEGDLRGLVCRR